jgi:hypothetical protein
VAKCPKCRSVPDEELTALDVYRVRNLVRDGRAKPTDLLRKIPCRKPGCSERYWLRVGDYEKAEVIAPKAA